MFSQSDIDILRLICWCQFVKPESLNSLSTPVERDNLFDMGLIQLHEKSGAFTLSRKGRSFLQEILPLPDLTKSYHKDAVERRLRLTNLALTAYKATVNIFLTAPEELSNSPSLFLSAITRSRGSNPWGSTRVAAIAHLGDLFCAVHYVCPGIGKIALTDELTAFSNQTARFSDTKRAFIFAGESYKDILTELEADTQADSKLIYGVHTSVFSFRSTFSPETIPEQCSFKSWPSLITAPGWPRPR